MKYMVRELESKNIPIGLEYYGPEDIATLLEVKDILKNNKIIIDMLQIIELEEILTIDEYLDYLYLKKLSLIEEVIPRIIDDENKQAIQKISNLAQDKCNQIKINSIIQYINNNYQEIFKEEYDIYFLITITIDLIIPYQNNISQEVFRYLAKNYGYLLIQKYDNFQKKFKKDPQLFELIFPKKDLREVCELQLETVLPVFIKIRNGKNGQLNDIISPIVENVIQELEKIMNELDSIPVQELLMLNHRFNLIEDFIKQIKHPKANVFREYRKRIDKRLADTSNDYAYEYSYRIPIEKLIEHLKNLPEWKMQMLSITHDCVGEDNSNQYVSRLACPSKGKQGIIDRVNVNFANDDYFTCSHQYQLSVIASIGAAELSTI